MDHVKKCYKKFITENIIFSEINHKKAENLDFFHPWDNFFYSNIFSLNKKGHKYVDKHNNHHLIETNFLWFANKLCNFCGKLKKTFYPQKIVIDLNYLRKTHKKNEKKIKDKCGLGSDYSRW